MVKLFIGNLAPTTTTTDLRKLFETYGSVSECDIIRNYGFIHMNNEDEAVKACTALNNQILDGKAIHIEFSTSKLRKAPGMDEVCFRCGEKSHKTKNCPLHDSSRDLKGGLNLKRLASLDDSYHPPPKRVECYFTPSREAASSGLAYGYLKSGTTTIAPAVTAKQDTMYTDPILQRPHDRSLLAIYDEYLAIRERYYYLRDRLSGNTSRQPSAVVMAAAPPTVQQSYYTNAAGQTVVQAAAPVQTIQQLPMQTSLSAPVVYATQQPTYATQQYMAAGQPQQLAVAAPQTLTTVEYYSQSGAAPRSTATSQRFGDVYYTRTANGYEARPMTVQGTTYQAVPAAAAAPHPPDVYYHRTDAGYEAFTMPSVATGGPNTATAYVIH